MKITMMRLSVCAALALMPSIIAAQPAMTQDELSTFVPTAVALGGGNPQKTVDALDRFVRARWGDFDTKAIVLVPFLDISKIGALAMAPYQIYRDLLGAKIRRFESTDDLVFDPRVVIAIEPAQMSAPDIVKVVVQRDGQTVEPVENRLEPKPFTNRLGASVTLHAGLVFYDAAAFAPGGKVQVILVPNVGKNIVTTLDEKRLAHFK